MITIPELKLKDANSPYICCLTVLHKKDRRSKWLLIRIKQKGDGADLRKQPFVTDPIALAAFLEVPEGILRMHGKTPALIAETSRQTDWFFKAWMYKANKQCTCGECPPEPES